MKQRIMTLQKISLPYKETTKEAYEMKEQIEFNPTCMIRNTGIREEHLDYKSLKENTACKYQYNRK